MTSTLNGPVRACVKCARLRPPRRRGLCSTCATQEHRAGTIDQWPTIERRSTWCRFQLAHPADACPETITRALDAAPTGRYGGRTHTPPAVHIQHPADRAAIVQLVADGELGRTRAAQLLHCSSTSLAGYLAALPTLIKETA